jgi:hypothetical protein
MVSKTFDYESYVKEYNIIINNKQLVESLLKAPKISKKQFRNERMDRRKYISTTNFNNASFRTFFPYHLCEKIKTKSKQAYSARPYPKNKNEQDYCDVLPIIKIFRQRTDTFLLKHA